MKKLFYLLVAFAFISCSDDNNTEQSKTGEKQLSSTVNLQYQDGVLYYKKVVYYENGKQSRDSLFDGNGVLLGHSVYAHTETNTTISWRNDVNGAMIKTIIQFDDAHRMLSFTEEQNGSPHKVRTYSYNNDGTVLMHTEYASGYSDQDYLYTYGPGGYLTTSVEITGGYGFGVQVNDQKAVAFYAVQDNSQFFISDIFYFPTAMPESIKKTVNDINNLILWNGDVRESARSGNFYVQNLWNSTFESTFDEENYITYRKETVEQVEPIVEETYYSYSEN